MTTTVQVPDVLAQSGTRFEALVQPAQATRQVEKINSFFREPVQAATLRLLCDFASGDAQRPLLRVDADWPAVFNALLRNGLTGLAYARLKHQPLEYPPPAFRASVKQAHIALALHAAKMYRTMHEVLTRLVEAGVDHLVVKGPALAQLVYPDAGLRSFTDLDLVIRERDHERAHRVLDEAGFASDRSGAHLPPKLTSHMVQHGSNYWRRDEGGPFLIDLHYDDLLEAGLASRDVDGFWERAVAVTVAGVPTRTLALDDQVIHLSAHVHYHGYSRLNWLTDLAFIVRDHAAEVDWERLIRTVRQEEAQVPVYYTLTYLDRLLGVRAPDAVLDAVRPDRFRRWLHERYMPDDQVVSLQPMSYPAFSFYFLPMFNRLLPDLLVMGRRWDKLVCLARLLAPPPGWLREYYRLHPHQHVAPHYLLHPLKLAHHYLSEIETATRRFWRRGRPGPDGEPVVWWCFIPPGRPASIAG